MIWVRRLLLAGFVTAILIGGWTLGHRNAAPVDVDGIFYRVEGARLWIVLLCAFVIGVVVSGFLMVTALMRSRLVARRYRKEVLRLEAEVHQLRTQPLSAAPDPVSTSEA